MRRRVIIAGLAAAGLLAAVIVPRFIPVNIPVIAMLFGSSVGFEDDEQLRQRLKLPDGFSINVYATGLGKARLMQYAEDGSILITDAADGKVYRVHPDKDADGRGDAVTPLIEDLDLPHGLLLEGDTLYVAAEAQVLKFDIDTTNWTVGEQSTLLPGLPDDGGHSTRTIARGPDGQLYVSVGSSCNVCIEKHAWRAAMIRFKADGSQAESFASGLRNTVGFDWQPSTGALYGVDNGRDWLGDEFPPDELNLIERGGFYGWPHFNGDNVPDPELGQSLDPSTPNPAAPAHAFDAHVAPLSIRFLRHQKTETWRNAALVALHGSWNRAEKAGYSVVSLHWDKDNTITEKPFLTGFEVDGDVIGRPVDIIEIDGGTLFVSDDLSGAIYRIQRNRS